MTFVVTISNIVLCLYQFELDEKSSISVPYYEVSLNLDAPASCF